MPATQSILDFARSTAPFKPGRGSRSILDVAKSLPPPFDPEGAGYDYQTAQKYGIVPDATGHLPSFEPTSGILLKGRKHPTYDKTLEAEEGLGNKIVLRDGRYYTAPHLNPELTQALTRSGAQTRTAPAVSSRVASSIPPSGDIRKSQDDKERIDNEFESFLKESVGISFPERPQQVEAVTGAAPSVPSAEEIEEERQAMRELILGNPGVPREFSAVNVLPELLTGDLPELGSRLYGEIRQPLAAATGPFREVLSRELPHSRHSLVRELGLEEPNATRDAIRAVVEGAASILPFMLTRSPGQFAGLAAGTTAGEEITREAYGERRDAGSAVLRVLASGLAGYGIGKVGHAFQPRKIPTLPASAGIFAAKAVPQGAIAYTHEIIDRAIEIADKEKLGYDTALKKAFVEIDGDPANFWKVVGEFGLYNLPGLARNVRSNLRAKATLPKPPTVEQPAPPQPRVQLGPKAEPTLPLKGEPLKPRPGPPKNIVEVAREAPPAKTPTPAKLTPAAEAQSGRSEPVSPPVSPVAQMRPEKAQERLDTFRAETNRRSVGQTAGPLDEFSTDERTAIEQLIRRKGHALTVEGLTPVDVGKGMRDLVEGIHSNVTGRVLAAIQRELVVEAPAKPEAPKNEELFDDLGRVVQGQPESQALVTGTRHLIDQVFTRLQRGDAIKNNRELRRLAEEAFGGTRMAGAYTPRDAYDALEAGVNRWLLQHGKALMEAEPGEALTQLRDLLSRLPRQTDRTQEQDEFQQFSTPPTLAYLAARALNPRPTDTVLEPSAGVGGLAAFARSAGAQVVVNEIAPRRAALLEELGFERRHSVDAENLDDLLPAEVNPTAILMNPPFSATGGRVGRHKTDFGAKHVEQALLRLENGGRLVAVVGEGMALDRLVSREWWEEIQGRYAVRMNLGIPGDEYQKYGTTFENQLLVIDKIAPTGEPVIHGKVSSLEEAIPLIQRVANERPEITAGPVEGDGGGVLPGDGAAGRSTPPGGRDLEPGRRGAAAEVPSGVSGETPSVPGEQAGRTPGRRREQSLERGPVSSRVAGDESVPPADGGQGERVVIERTTGPIRRKAEAGGTFVEYRPSKIRSGKKHPASIVESASMAGVDPPEVRYTPQIPTHLIDRGALSDIQLEAITYAGQRHERILPNGRRAGFALGDGTGVGKGRQIAGIVLDNWNQGRRRALWVSASRDLINDARRDFTGIDAGHIPLKLINDYPRAEDIVLPEGVIFSTYQSLISAQKEGKVKKGGNRLEQIARWLGDDGVIVFDEAHKAKNGVPMGRSEPTQTGQAVIDLQEKHLPKARVVYASATGATDVRNMAYMTRLGLWGPGTAFPKFMDFMTDIERGGVGAMEMVSRDMKTLGMYASRNLSYEGVDYDEIVHTLTPEQERMYNAASELWQVVYQNFERAIELTNGGGRQRGAARQKFWGDHQRFFRQLLTALKVPTVIKRTERALAENRSVVISLIGTAESRTASKAAAAMAEGTDLEDLDFTPREVIANLVMRAFPTQAYQDATDPDTGNTIKVPLRDKDGNPIESREAVRLRDQLLEKLNDVNLPDNPLDQIVNHFGSTNVAEMTGRKRRLIRDETGKLVYTKRSPEGVAMKDVNVHENEQFQKGKKHVAIISDAASTGISLHADLSAENQQRREQITLELGWSADKQLQTFGRTHRSNQASAPQYTLLSTNLGGEKRFSSTIARRLQSLGALTKGQRDATSGGDLAKYNFETVEGAAALTKLYSDIMMNDEIPGVEDPKQALRDIGILEDRGEGEKIKPEDTLDVQKFLNRVLALQMNRQNALFNAFTERFDQTVQHAKESGTFDDGVVDITAEGIRVQQEAAVFRDKATDAESIHHTLELDRKTSPLRPEDLPPVRDNGGFFQQERSGKLIYVASAGSKTDPLTGNIVDTFHRWAPEGKLSGLIAGPDLIEKYSRVNAKEATELWNQRYREAPTIRTESMHVISGAILPIWNKLKSGKSLKVVRLETDEGRRIVGVQIPKADVGAVLSTLGRTQVLSGVRPKELYDRIAEEGLRLKLTGGMEVLRTSISGNPAIEVSPVRSSQFEGLRSAGLVNERIDWKQRFFVPFDEIEGPEVLKRLLELHPPEAEAGEVAEAREIDYTVGREHLTIAHGSWRQARAAVREAADELEALARPLSQPPGVPGTGVGPGRLPDLPTRSVPAGLRKFGRIDFSGIVFSSHPRQRALQFAQLAQVARHPKMEHLVSTMLIKGKPVAYHAITSGVLNAVDVRGGLGRYAIELLSRATRLGADEIILMHNHPSGNAKPSKEDVRFTSHLIQLLRAPRIHHAVALATGRTPVDVNVSMHVIINHGKYSVLREDPTAETPGYIEQMENLDLPGGAERVEWDIERRVQITGQDDAIRIAREIMTEKRDDRVAFMYLDVPMKLVGYNFHQKSILERPSLEQVVRDEARSHGAAKVIIGGKNLSIPFADLPERFYPNRDRSERPWVLDIVDLDNTRYTAASYMRQQGSLQGDVTPAARQVFEEEAVYEPAKGEEAERVSTWKEAAQNLKRSAQSIESWFKQYVGSRRMQYGRAAFRVDRDVDRMIGKAKAEAAEEIAVHFLNPEITPKLEKIFGIRGAIAIGRRLRELPYFGKLFGIPRNRRELIRAVAESIRGRDDHGKLVFGAMERLSDPEVGAIIADVRRKIIEREKLQAMLGPGGTVKSAGGRQSVGRYLSILDEEIKQLETEAKYLLEQTELVDRVIDGVNLTQEGEQVYHNHLTKQEQRVVDWFVDWREEMKDRYGIQGTIEGYVRRFMLDPRHPFLPSLVSFKRNKFFNRIAGSRFFRVGGNYDYLKDLELIAYLTKKELETERIHNGYVPMILEMMLEPAPLSPIEQRIQSREWEMGRKFTKVERDQMRKTLKEDPVVQEEMETFVASGEGIKPGYQRVRRTAVFGPTPYTFDGQIKDVLYNEFIRLVEEPQKIDDRFRKRLYRTLRTGADYWTANQLIAMQSIANQAVSDAIFYGMRLAYNLPNPRRLVNDLRALGTALRPSVLRRLTPEEFGSMAVFTRQLSLRSHYESPFNAVRGVLNLYFKVFNAFDLFVKRAGFLSEAHNIIHEEIAKLVARGVPKLEAKEQLKDLILNPERIRELSRNRATVKAGKYQNVDMDRDIDEILDMYFPNYANIPLHLEKFADNPAGKLFIPFVRYRYEELRLAGRILRDGLKALNPKYGMPADERIGAILLASVVFGGAILLAQRYMTGLLESEEEEAKDIAAGRLGIKPGSPEDTALRRGLDTIGIEVSPDETLFLRASKYPFVKFGMLLRSDADATKVIQSEFVSEGIAARLLAYTAGWEDEFSKYSTGEAKLGKEAASLVPTHRVFEDINRIRNPRMLRPETFEDAVRKALPGVEQTGKEVVSRETGQPLEMDPGLSTLLATTGINIASLPEMDILLQKQLNKVDREKREKARELVQRYNQATSPEERSAIRREARESNIENFRRLARAEAAEEELGMNEAAVIRMFAKAAQDKDPVRWEEAQQARRTLKLSRSRIRSELESIGLRYERP